ncbi:MAG TPA: tripartite tricarboxylate transporter substrate-binding protein [Burkholderiales bacterium]|nr:tripartite tricarboxylate transporter substrate-binding protein [Burkholderiales bacterium]
MKTSTVARWICSIALIQFAAAAHAQDARYPVRPVRLIVPASTGTGMDYLGRAVAQALSESYRQQVIVDNRAGAGSLIGSGIVASAAPDGYTLGVASTSTIVAPLLQAKPPYRPLQDFAPIALLSSITSVLVAAPGVPAKNVQEFIALLKAHPGQYNFASIGAGSASHLTAEIFNRAAGIDAVHVPFKSVADVYTEMLASRVHYLVWISPASLPMVREGKMRALAVTSAKRYAGLPDVPTVAESGLKGAEVDTMIGVVGPATLGKPMVSRLYADFQDVLKRPGIRTTFDRQGGEPAVGVTTAEYAQKWRAEYELYRRLLPEIGLKPQ